MDPSWLAHLIDKATACRHRREDLERESQSTRHANDELLRSCAALTRQLDEERTRTDDLVDAERSANQRLQQRIESLVMAGKNMENLLRTAVSDNQRLQSLLADSETKDVPSVLSDHSRSRHVPTAARFFNWARAQSPPVDLHFFVRPCDHPRGSHPSNYRMMDSRASFLLAVVCADHMGAIPLVADREVDGCPPHVGLLGVIHNGGMPAWNRISVQDPQDGTNHNDSIVVRDAQGCDVWWVYAAWQYVCTNRIALHQESSSSSSSFGVLNYLASWSPMVTSGPAVQYTMNDSQSSSLADALDAWHEMLDASSSSSPLHRRPNAVIIIRFHRSLGGEVAAAPPDTVEQKEEWCVMASNMLGTQQMLYVVRCHPMDDGGVRGTTIRSGDSPRVAEQGGGWGVRGEWLAAGTVVQQMLEVFNGYPHTQWHWQSAAAGPSSTSRHRQLTSTADSISRRISFRGQYNSQDGTVQPGVRCSWDAWSSRDFGDVVVERVFLPEEGDDRRHSAHHERRSVGSLIPRDHQTHVVFCGEWMSLSPVRQHRTSSTSSSPHHRRRASHLVPCVVTIDILLPPSNARATYDAKNPSKVGVVPDNLDEVCIMFVWNDVTLPESPPTTAHPTYTRGVAVNVDGCDVQAATGLWLPLLRRNGEGVGGMLQPPATLCGDTVAPHVTRHGRDTSEDPLLLDEQFRDYMDRSADLFATACRDMAHLFMDHHTLLVQSPPDATLRHANEVLRSLLARSNAHAERSSKRVTELEHELEHAVKALASLKSAHQNIQSRMLRL